MFTPLKFAALALPFVSAVPLISSSTRNTIDGRGLSPSSTGNSVTDIIKSGENLVEQVNDALYGILPNKIDSEVLLEGTFNRIRQQNFQDNALFASFAGLFQAIVANQAPKDIPDALTEVENTLGTASDSSVTIENIAQLLLNGLSVTDLSQNVLNSYNLSPINSYTNSNPPAETEIYPKKQQNDAPYDIPEKYLRAAIYIPPGFTNGKKRPILFVPGTGSFGGVNFISNLGKLFGGDDRFDPVYLNVPGAMYNDTQINSEYIAYAINYLSSNTGRQDLAVIAWSQGNVDTQWAFQYWPSTRSVVTDFISASADFHGTTLAYFLDPAFIDVPLPPSIIQQEYDSNFIQTLRLGGGGSPYVPSTTVWSLTFDQIVQPQYSPYASASYFAQDLAGTPSTQPYCPANSNVAYTNNQIQTICKDKPAGAFYTHEGVLYNPLMYALALDALTHDGPGSMDRIDLSTVCSQVVAPGLSLDDVIATEGLISLAILNLLLYPDKATQEPAVQQYALQVNSAMKAGNCNSASAGSLAPAGKRSSPGK